MKNKYLLFIIILLALFLRFINLNQSFWLDEAAQAFESGRPFLQQFQLAAVFHPPLYHVLLHLWIKGGASEIWMRLPSVAFGVVSVWLLYRLGTILAGRRSGLLAGLFLAVSPFHIWYSQEARPYMFASLVILACTYWYLTRRWNYYALFLTASLYSTYLAFCLIPVHAAGMFLWEKNRYHRIGWMRSTMAALICFAPWLPSFFGQLAVGTNGALPGWTSVVSIGPIKSVPLTLAKFIFGKGSIDNNVLYGLVIAPAFIVFCYAALQIGRKEWGKTILLLFLGPLFLAALISFIVPVTAPQRLLFLLPLFYLILAAGTANLSGRRLLPFSAIILCTSIIGIGQYWTDPKVQREQWRQAVWLIEAEAPARSLAVFLFPDPFAPYLWYQTGTVPGIGIAPAFRVNEEDMWERLPDELLRQTDRIYLFHYLADLTGPIEIPQRYIVSRGFIDAEVKNFEGVGFITVYEHL